MSRCSSCNVEIRWALMASGARMPFDVKPVKAPTGMYVLDNLGFAKSPSPMHMTHYATCPDADEHRKPKPALPGGVADDAAGSAPGHVRGTPAGSAE